MAGSYDQSGGGAPRGHPRVGAAGAQRRPLLPTEPPPLVPVSTSLSGPEVRTAVVPPKLGLPESEVLRAFMLGTKVAGPSASRRFPVAAGRVVPKLVTAASPATATPAISHAIPAPARPAVSQLSGLPLSQ